MKNTAPLPITKDEMNKLAWEQADVIIVSGDAYVDHPSFGAAVIGRVIESKGLKVAILPQPNWQDDLRDFKKLGKPKYFFGVTAGNMDSMLNRYTANKRLRSDDAYTPGGKFGFRPDYASIVYSNILKELFPDVPIILGGIEASMRRLTHYDYWSDSLKKPILLDSKADVLVYGMGEKPIADILKFVEKYGINSLLKEDSNHHLLSEINQIGFTLKKGMINSLKEENYIELKSHEEQLKSKFDFAENFKIIEQNSNLFSGKTLIEKTNDEYVIITKQNEPASSKELDEIYELPYTRKPHPKYLKRGEIPAYNMIKNSINIHRGCFGACAFCTISAHQGKFISSRSAESVLKEVDIISQMPDFGGTISDLGGPSANMYKMRGEDIQKCKKCRKTSCIYPEICSNLNFDHQPLLELYYEVKKNSKIKHIFIGSGIRYDMFFPKETDKARKYKVYEYAQTVIKYHTGGRLKVAPEHCSNNVLEIMRKPSFKVYNQFNNIFDKICRDNNLKYQLIPYFISAHPACTISDMAELAIETKRSHYHPEQVQTFTPTPMTLSTTIYYAGINPYTKEKVYTAKSIQDKKQQNLFLFWHKPENKMEITRVLNKIGRKDLIKKLYGNE
ncbi:MAG: YgiQ family radical SAM protein [Bacteroidales bacterium]|jgi:uncharacterized radical SAM protein YgiQ|nr:YgiQ family radical SAM protein [Bacteroidales bacterium]